MAYLRSAGLTSHRAPHNGWVPIAAGATMHAVRRCQHMRLRHHGAGTALIVTDAIAGKVVQQLAHGTGRVVCLPPEAMDRGGAHGKGSNAGGMQSVERQWRASTAKEIRMHARKYASASNQKR